MAFNWHIKGLLVLATTALMVTGCASAPIQLGVLPKPAPTDKLRVFVQPISGPAHPRSGRWLTPDKEFQDRARRAIAHILQRKGFYELTGSQEEAAVLGNRTFPYWKWKKDDWALARQAGKALHAEYTIVMERGYLATSPYWRVALINVETGRHFSVYAILLQGGGKDDFTRMVKASFREIFRDAKGDLLATAIRKSRYAAASGTDSASRPETSAAGSPPESAISSPAAHEPTAGAAPDLGREIDLAAALEIDAPAQGKTQVAVHDFEAAENQRVVALILAEALREELFNLGTFTIVDRENLKETLAEISLGQAGIVDAAQAAQAGRLLAAQQIVMGRLSGMEKASILQVKRLETETQRALAIVSEKCRAGEEEQLLDRMPQLARKLAGRQ